MAVTLNAYLALSATMLLFIACTWAAKGWGNIAIKLTYMLAALIGCVMVARAFAL